MRVRNARELGLLVREKRREREWSQQELAERIGASRHWVMGVERGKATAETGLVLAALAALGLTVDIRARGAGEAEAGSGRARGPDLEAVLGRARGRRAGLGGEAGEEG